MVRIGLISDTHFINTDCVKLPKSVETVFCNVDKIFHAGDIISSKVLKKLSKLAPVLAVKGNMDLYGELKNLPTKLIEEIEGVKIGLIHGWGPPSGIIERIKTQFPPDVNCVVYGHTHSPSIKKEEGVWFLNPGAAVDRIYTLRNSIGLLIVDGENIQAEIIEI